MKTQLMTAVFLAGGIASAVTYPIVDTAQIHCYDDRVAIVDEFAFGSITQFDWLFTTPSEFQH